MEALLTAARLWPQNLLTELDRLGADTLPNRGAVARAIVENAEAGMPLREVRSLEAKLKMSGPEAFAFLAQPLIERHGYTPLDVLQTLGVVDSGLLDLRCDFQLHGAPAFEVFANVLLEAYPPAPAHRHLMTRLSQALAESPLDATGRAALAGRMAQRSDAAGLLPALDRLGIDEATARHLAREIASRCKLDKQVFKYLSTAPEPMRLAVAMGQQAGDIERMQRTGEESLNLGIDLSDASRFSLFAEGVRLAAGLRDTRFKSMGDAVGYARRSWAPLPPAMDTEDPQALKDAFSQIDHHPLFVSIFDKADANSNERLRAERMAWALDAASCLGSLKDAETVQLEKDLAFLDNQHAPSLRQQLTDALICNVHVHGVSAYAAFADGFKRPKMRGFAIAMHSLYAKEGAAPSLALIGTLSHSSFKDSRQLYPALRDLLSLADAGARHLSVPAMCQLLERAVPAQGRAGAQGAAQERSDGLRRNLRLLAVLVKSLDDAPDASVKNTLSALASMPPGTDLGKQLEPLLLRLMPGSDAAKTGGAQNPSWLQGRQTESLLVYRQNLATALNRNEDEREGLRAVLQALDRYADAALWSPDPVAAFARLRYAPEASPHLKHLAENAPKAYQAWQQAVQTDSPPGLGALKVVDTDKADDLFLSGTDVAGSCLAVSGDPAENKALMGYLLDGKYRMLALQSEGVTQARRIVRLLVDEQTREPVLFVERLYANTGIKEGGNEDQALLALAHAKAATLACPVLCETTQDIADEDYPHKVASLGTPAPFEFVDAAQIYWTAKPYALAACHVERPE